MDYLPNFPRTIYNSECAVFRGGLIKTGLLSFGANGLHAGDVDQEQNTNHCRPLAKGGDQQKKMEGTGSILLGVNGLHAGDADRKTIKTKR